MRLKERFSAQKLHKSAQKFIFFNLLSASVNGILAA